MNFYEIISNVNECIIVLEGRRLYLMILVNFLSLYEIFEGFYNNLGKGFFFI